jgi:hypothetical protein
LILLSATIAVADDFRDSSLFFGRFCDEPKDRVGDGYPECNKQKYLDA